MSAAAPRVGRLARVLLAGSVGAAAAALLADRVLPGADPGFGRGQRLLLLLALLLLLGFVLALRGRARRRGLVALLATLLALGGAELFLRVALRAELSAHFAPDVACLFRYEPGARWTFRRSPENGGDRIPVAINALGFRGPAPAPGGLRVAVYGDSFVAAEFTEERRTFVRLLGAALAAASGREVQALNLGVAGYGPDQVAVRLETELAELAPDLLVVALLAENDFGDVVRDGLFELDAGGRLVRRERPPAELERGPLVALVEARSRPFVARLWLRARGRLQGEIDSGGAGRTWRADALLRACRRETERHLARAPGTPPDLFWDHYDADVALEPASGSARTKVALLGAVLARIADLARAADVPLLFVAIPSAIDVCGEHDVLRVDRTAYPAYRPAATCALVTELSEHAGAPCVDLFEPFREADPCTLYFVAGDTHWNDAGQALAARVVATAALELLRDARAGRIGLPR